MFATPFAEIKAVWTSRVGLPLIQSQNLTDLLDTQLVIERLTSGTEAKIRSTNRWFPLVFHSTGVHHASGMVVWDGEGAGGDLSMFSSYFPHKAWLVRLPPTSDVFATWLASSSGKKKWFLQIYVNTRKLLQLPLHRIRNVNFFFFFKQTCLGYSI